MAALAPASAPATGYDVAASLPVGPRRGGHASARVVPFHAGSPVDTAADVEAPHEEHAPAKSATHAHAKGDITSAGVDVHPRGSAGKSPRASSASSLGVVQPRTLRDVLCAVVESPLAACLSVFVTLWALVGDYLRVLTVHAPHDADFLPGTVACIAWFATEAALLSVCRPKYFLGFYFWLDMLSTLSLLFDLPQVLLLLQPVGAGQTTGTGGTLAAAGSTAYAAAKVGQILRLVRLARMLTTGGGLEGGARGDRLSWLRRPTASFATIASGRRSGAGGGDSAANSRVGSKLGDLTTRRVVLGVWCILLASPLFETKFYPQGNPTSFEFGGLQVVHDTCAACALAVLGPSAATAAGAGGGGGGGGTASQVVGLPPLNATSAACVTSCYATMDAFVAHTQGLLRLSVLGTDVGTSRYGLPGVSPALRAFEQLPVDVSATSSTVVNASVTVSTGTTSAVFNRAGLYRLKAILGLCRIAFLGAMLAAGVFYFTKDAERLVLRPIERMMRKVQDMGDNPLLAAATSLDDDAAAAAAGPGGGRRSVTSVRGGLAARLRARALAKAENYETRLLESSVSKICSLMALAFGDAGAQIIADNMRSGGALNPMVPGKKMCAVFGFCDIRSFTDATEVLQEEVMEFVNTIARLVHSHVTSRGGAANKNIGDAFLLVWKFPPGVTPDDVAALAAGIPPPGGPVAAAAVAAVADNALAAFVAVYASLRSSPLLARFNTHAGLKARLGTGYTGVRMGFGLHVGWAIEGAIGSEYKVDASYLSPHVNIAARLEAATKQFGVPLLLSSQFATLLSPDVRAQCRVVDCVALKGCKDPLHLYTFDADADFLPLATAAEAPATSPKRGSGSIASSAGGGSATGSALGVPLPADTLRGSSATSGSAALADGAAAGGADYGASSSPGALELLQSPYVACMRGTLPPQFLAHWRTGFDAYTAGRWTEARDALTQRTLHTRLPAAGAPVAPDGPSQALLDVMEKHSWKAPHGWRGFRELTEK